MASKKTSNLQDKNKRKSPISQLEQANANRGVTPSKGELNRGQGVKKGNLVPIKDKKQPVDKSRKGVPIKDKYQPRDKSKTVPIKDKNAPVDKNRKGVPIKDKNAPVAMNKKATPLAKNRKGVPLKKKEK